MLEFFQPLKKFCSQEKVAIDNGVFRLHYKVTVLLFILFSAMLTAKQYFGDPIDCMVSGVPTKIVNIFCWIHGTYTLKNYNMDQTRPLTVGEQAYFDKLGHTGISHPGIETTDPSKNYKIYHTYYQWVGFILFFQAVSFYFPRHLWKHMEGGRVRFCTKDMKEPELDDEVRLRRVNRLKKSYMKFQDKNNMYALKFFFCEIINLVNVIIQIFYINKFIGGRFLNYGAQILNFYNNIEMGIDPMVEVFPKVTKCQFNRHGPGGDINNHDALCLLPLNIVNEKIYLAMWMWLIALVVASTVAILYRATCVLVPGVRTYLLWGETTKWSHIAEVCNNGRYGDWFLLRQMSKNVDQETFDEFLKHLSKEVNQWEENGTPSRMPTLMRSPTWVGGWFRSRNSDSGCSTGRNSRKEFEAETSTCEP